MADFTFADLDELLQATMLGDGTYIDKNLRTKSIAQIGPLVEYSFQHPAFSKLPSLDSLSGSVPARTLCESRQSANSTETSCRSKSIEFIRLSLGYMNSPNWIALMKRFEDACASAGFSKSISRSMTCAFGEMTDNVFQHSERPVSGLVGYRFNGQRLEYVVADAGIGILQSLRQCAEYAHVSDHGEALKTALSPNQSRFGSTSGRGTGFEAVFGSLANLRGTLRFRSGDHVLELDGRDLDLTKGQLRQCPPHFQGLFVSIVCNSEKKLDDSPSVAI